MALSLTRMVAGTTETAASINLWADGIEATDARVDTAINPPELHVYRAAAFASVAVTTFQLVTWDTELTDTNSVFTPSSSRVPCPVSGKYLVTFSLAMPTAATTVLHPINVRLNSAGSQVAGTGVSLTSYVGQNTPVNFCATFPVRMVAGDYLELFYARSAATYTPVAGQYSSFIQLLKTRD